MQSESFGFNRSLSIEGCSCDYHTQSLNNNDDISSVKMDFHSFFSDDSLQNAATTFEHMKNCTSGLLHKH